MNIAIRLAIVPQDYPAIAVVLQAESPEWGATADELAHDDAGRDPRYYWAVLVAEAAVDNTPLMVGVAFIGQDTLAQREGAFEIDLRVRPDWQGRGVGKALYQAALAQLAPLAPHELTAMVWQAHPRSARFLIDRGFVETWQRIDSYLDVAGFDWTPYAGLEERLESQGIQIVTYAELAGDSDRLTRLYELDCALWQDVPYGQAVVRRSPRQYATETVNHPSYLPDACFIALKDGAFVGYSNLLAIEAGYSIDMTGVLRAYRGKGVATALKLRGIRYAQEHGNRRLWAVNDSANAAMLALNQKLGFVREGMNVRYVKRLASG
jgi:GNAT superfamily N-acetyltransferase